MKDIIKGVIAGTLPHSDLEIELGKKIAQKEDPDNKVRGVYRLGVLLMSSPDKVNDAQFLNRFAELTGESTVKQSEDQ